MPPIGYNKKYTVFLVTGILINLINIPQANRGEWYLLPCSVFNKLQRQTSCLHLGKLSLTQVTNKRLKSPYVIILKLFLIPMSNFKLMLFCLTSTQLFFEEVKEGFIYSLSHLLLLMLHVFSQHKYFSFLCCSGCSRFSFSLSICPLLILHSQYLVKHSPPQLSA